MAEEYYVGKRRIVYKSVGFITGLNVSVDMYFSSGEKESGINLIEIENGLYYFNYFFPTKGMYTGIFYENGIKKIAQNFRVIIEPSFNGGGRIVSGDRLINL